MKYINKKLSIEKHYFQDIAQKYNTPTYCYSYSRLRENILNLINELQLKGHKINYPVPPIGGGQMILIDEEKDLLVGASDWRKDGLAIGY